MGRGTDDAGHCVYWRGNSRTTVVAQVPMSHGRIYEWPLYVGANDTTGARTYGLPVVVRR
jgi:hypothetical protein